MSETLSKHRFEFSYECECLVCIVWLKCGSMQENRIFRVDDVAVFEKKRRFLYENDEEFEENSGIYSQNNCHHYPPDSRTQQKEQNTQRKIHIPHNLHILSLNRKKELMELYIVIHAKSFFLYIVEDLGILKMLEYLRIGSVSLRYRVKFERHRRKKRKLCLNFLMKFVGSLLRQEFNSPEIVFCLFKYLPFFRCFLSNLLTEIIYLIEMHFQS